VEAENYYFFVILTFCVWLKSNMPMSSRGDSCWSFFLFLEQTLLS